MTARKEVPGDASAAHDAKRHVVSARTWAKEQGYRVEYGMLKIPQKHAVVRALIALKNEPALKAQIAKAEEQEAAFHARAEKRRAQLAKCDEARKVLDEVRAALAAARETMERPFKSRST